MVFILKINLFVEHIRSHFTRGNEWKSDDEAWESINFFFFFVWLQKNLDWLSSFFPIESNISFCFLFYDFFFCFIYAFLSYILHSFMIYAAKHLGMPYLSPYIDSIGTSYRNGANFAAGSSTIRRQNKTFFDGGTPFVLEIQTEQFNQFKSRTAKFFQPG